MTALTSLGSEISPEGGLWNCLPTDLWRRDGPSCDRNEHLGDQRTRRHSRTRSLTRPSTGHVPRGRMVSSNIRIHLEPQNMTLFENRVHADVMR